MKLNKDPKKLWEKVKAVLLNKQVPKEVTLQQNFFHKIELKEGNKLYTTYSLSPSSPFFLKIRNLKPTLDKEQLIDSFKCSVDFTGNISIILYYIRNLARRRNIGLLLL